MISFEDIDKPSRMYDFYMKFLSLAHNHIYYRNFYIVNRENYSDEQEMHDKEDYMKCVL